MLDNDKLILVCKHGTKEWHEQRKLNIGSSSISTIYGCNPYRSPLMEYNVRLGLMEEPEAASEMQDQWDFGKYMEPFLLQKLIERNARKGIDISCLKLNENTLRLSSINPRFNSTPDAGGRINAERADGIRIGGELKTVSFHLREQWLDSRIPFHVYCQCQWHIYCLGLARVYLIACIAGNMRECYDHVVEPDLALIEELKAKAEYFINCLDIKQEPLAIEMDLKHLPAPKHDKITACDDESFVELCASYDALAKEKKQSDAFSSAKEKAMKDIRSQIVQKMGDSTLGLFGSYEVKRTIVTRKPSLEESISERFSLKIKEG